MGTEIERKFRLTRPAPSMILYAEKGKYLLQGYLPVKEGEVRLRRESFSPKYPRYLLTVKSEGGMVREEEEIEITQGVFIAMWQLVTAELKKERFTFQPHEFSLPGAKPLELDIYNGELWGLQVLEREFGSEEEAAAFVLPNEFAGAIEVTNDKRFKNKNLARNPEAVKEFLLRY